MKVIVLGAGILGTASAWFLQKAGHEVTVIDRQPGVAQETSFANGCQISVSHAEPWSNPGAPLKLLRWLSKDDAPLLFRPRADWLQWRWGLKFLRECTPDRAAHNIRQIVALAEYSRQTLQALRAETGIEYDCETRGILHFYTDPSEFEQSLAAAQLMRDLGCPRRSVDADEAVRLEPALASMRSKLVGADFTPTDESGDVYKFTAGLARACEQSGTRFVFNTIVTRLLTEGSGTSSRIAAVEVIDAHGRHEQLKADSYVLAMGSFSQPLAKRIGIDLMIYPGKGYSATYMVKKPALTPTVSLTDDGYKLVISRLGDRLRVAGTAEINGYSRELNEVRCEAITRRTRELFPNACDYENPVYWSGLRPMTPSNIPYIGRSRYSNLFLNTGHGTLGWTMGCGSGRAIADIVSERQPDLNFEFTGETRHALTPPLISIPARG
jgi:D-amino-acid dehydrogenase